jgi:hypothetical protein
MPYVVTNMDAAKILKQQLLLQILGGVKAPETEVINNVFKKKKNVDGDKVSRQLIARTIKAVPFVGQKNPGVVLNGKTVTADGITVPPMKCHSRIEASDFAKIKNLLGQERRAAIAEELQYIKDTVAWNREWYARHFLATGNCNYPFLVDGNAIADNYVYSLGTMTAADAPPSVLFDNASATLTDVIKHLDHMFKKGEDVPNRNYFQDSSQTLTYARTAVWNAIYDILDGKQTTSVVTGKRDGDVLEVGPYKIKKFDAATVSPVDQSAGNGIPVKQMRMIDTSTGAPHTMANLEIENTKAVGGQKHVFIYPVEDPYGNYVDIMCQHRPVGMFIPEACVNSLDVIA